MASKLASTLPAIWVIRMMPTRSRRSARAPASGLKKTTGKNSAIDMTPSQVPEWVKVQASQPTATRCIQMPTSETALPPA